MESKAKCENCAFYFRGVCRRYPPQLVVEFEPGNSSRTESMYPEVLGWFWCGEWKKLEPSYDSKMLDDDM